MKRYSTVSGVEIFVVILIVLILIGGAAWTVVGWHMESKTYNRLTGASTTWWDAVWVELRVQDQPIK